MSVINRARAVAAAAVLAVSIPALAIFAFPDPDEPLPNWYDRNDRQLLANLAELDQLGDSTKRKSIELFRNGMKSGYCGSVATHSM